MFVRRAFIVAAIMVTSAHHAICSAKTPFPVVATIQSRQTPVLKYGDVIAFGNFEIQIYGIYADHNIFDNPQNAYPPSHDHVGMQGMRCDLTGTLSNYSGAEGSNFLPRARRPFAMCYVDDKDIAEQLVFCGAAEEDKSISQGIYTELEKAGRHHRSYPPQC